MVRVANLVKLGFGVWILRWAAQELAAHAGRRWQQPGPPPRDSLRRPGWMPGPSAETLRKFSEP
jgi:hypothetical protein